MFAKRCASLLAVAVMAPCAGATSTAATANPIRKVVTMLQAMQQKVIEEGQRAEDLYKKYNCYCQNSGKDLAASIEASEQRLAELGPAIEGATAKKTATEEELKTHQSDRAAAETAMQEATAIRQKEQATFDQFMGESKTNLEALVKAIAAVEKGMGGGFLQTRSASVLRTLISKLKDLEDSDRDAVVAFLQGDSSYSPQSGEITGILKTIKDEMFAEQQQTIAIEEAAVKSYDELMAAKKKEVAVLSKSIEEKLARIGQLGVEIAQMQSDLGDSADSLEEDKKFKADLEQNCASAADVHEKEKMVRAEEQVALADVIKVLNDDDALDLFKNTLPSASSFMQVKVSTSSQRAEALSVLARAQGRFDASMGRHRLDIVMLALSGKKIGFEKVIAMVDNLVATLKQEQVDDDTKREYCAAQFDQSEDKKKALERQLADLSTVIAETKEAIATTTEEIAALEKGIAALDKAVAEATEQRKAENSEYKDLMANNGAAKELLLFAKNRLNKFYNPKLYKAAPKQELSREDRIFVNNGGTPPPTKAPGGIAGTGIAVPAFVQLASTRRGEVAPPPPPATAEAYKAKSSESNGVLAMMDLLIKELQTEMTTAEAEEKAAQGNYEQAMTDSAEKRAMDSKSLTDRESAKADLQALLERSEGEHGAASADLSALQQYIASLHTECDWLLQYFDVRKQARADEIDSLEKAKAVLSGANFALLQRSSLARTRKFLRH